MLFLDYLEESDHWLREQKKKLHKLDEEFRRIADSDIRKEIRMVRNDISQKEGEIVTELLFNLEEFRAIRKYFPELMATLLEDDCIGKVISRKVWLLDVKQLPPKLAAARLEQIRQWRLQVAEARIYIRRWVGKIDTRFVTSNYSFLAPYLSGRMEKDEIEDALKQADKALIHEGWIVLVTDSLIHLPLQKFTAKLNDAIYEEKTLLGELKKAKGTGTIAETKAQRKYELGKKKVRHWERIITQILLANPGYLGTIKVKKNWLSRAGSNTLEKLAQKITPRRIRERIWLDEMKKKLDL